MSALIVFAVALTGILLSKALLKKWFNHLSLYCVVMGGLIFFYELKLLPYHDLIPLAWFFIITSFLSYLFGILTIIAIKNYTNKKTNYNHSKLNLPIFQDGGKALKYSVIFFSLIGLFVALHRWYVLIGMFGSIEAVFINAYAVYRLNVEGEIKEFIPILPSFIYVGVFLAGVYTAYKGKFTFLSFFPILCIILKELTYFGRGEMLFSTMEFFFAFLLTRHLLSNNSSVKFKFSRLNAIVSITILLIFLLTASSFVRESRRIPEKFPGASRELKVLKDNFFITPSVYLYLSCDIGVFSKYLEKGTEEARLGENTFRGVYFLLSKFNVVESPKFFQKGYFIPMWANTGSYLREIHADFGSTGVFLINFLLGSIITTLWLRFYERRSLMILVILVYLFLIIGFSFLVMVTRLNQWWISQAFILFYIPILNFFATRNTLLLNQRIERIL